MGALPSASYSITVRLEVPAGGTSVSQLTTAVESAGGSVIVGRLTDRRAKVSGRTASGHKAAGSHHHDCVLVSQLHSMHLTASWRT
jgi:hypothetical protein